MIHSGSALGGHYYAYIKSFDSERWYNFNDSNVKEIDEKDYWNCLVQLIVKKVPIKADWKEQQKITTWLMSRGFELELIKEAFIAVALKQRQ